jgi:hypothetical protein
MLYVIIAEDELRKVVFHELIFNICLLIYGSNGTFLFNDFEVLNWPEFYDTG